MKNLKKVSDVTRESGFTPLYYSFEKDAVYTTPGEGRFFVTYLIRHNTPEEVGKAVERWVCL